MHRVLAVLIVLLLAGGAAAVVVKSDDDDTVPIVQPTPTPSETFTFDGVAPTETPTEEPTETPVEPGTEEPTVEPTDTMSELPKTGGGSFAGVALLTLVIALGAGVAVNRAGRSTA